MGCNLEHEISSLKVYDCLYNEFLQDGNQEIREKISKEGEGLLDSAKDYYALNKEKREEEIIVSLTTIPSRLEAVAYPIKCMLVQTMRPDRIILWIDKSINQESLPDTLCELQKYGLEIRYVEDVGPHTKYFYAIKEFADSIVITIDDDVFYRRNLIEDLYATHKKYPKCVCACWVWEMKFTYN